MIGLAEDEDTEVVFTRSSDVEMLRNTPKPVKLVSVVLFYGVIAYSLLSGVFTGDRIRGPFLFLGGVVLPLAVIRFWNTKFLSGKNRDKIIAEKIKEVSETGSEILAIVGASHLSVVRERLPEDFEVEVKKPEHPRFSKKTLIEFLKGLKGFLAFLGLYVFLTVFLSYLINFML